MYIQKIGIKYKLYLTEFQKQSEMYIELTPFFFLTSLVCMGRGSGNISDRINNPLRYV